jgi:hypothetical protein
MREWSQDGDVENNEKKTLPERPQRSHWKFNTKYTSKFTKIGYCYNRISVISADLPPG